MTQNPDIINCIQILNEEPTWNFWRDNNIQKLQCLDTIKNIGTPTDIFHLIKLLRADNADIRNKAAETIVYLFSKLTSLNDYYDSLHTLGIYENHMDFYRKKFNRDTYVKLLAIASLNYNGYVRQKAVTELGNIKTSEALKFVMLRLGDWVVQVRQAAADALYSFLDAKYIDIVLTQLPLIKRLLTIKRVNLTGIHNSIIEFILQQEFSGDFYNKIVSLNNSVRLQFYTFFLRSIKPVPGQLIKIARDRNFLVRLEVLRVLSRFDAALQKELIKAFLKDKSAKVRLTALQAARAFGVDFNDAILTMLSDESAAVRELCRYILKDSGIDFAEIYRDRLKNNKPAAGNISGLAEVGTKDDLPIFKEYINSTETAIIISCLNAFNKFNAEAAKIYCISLFSHSSAKVRTRASEILLRIYHNSIFDTLRIMYTTANATTKRTILKFYGSAGGWYVPGDLLLALTDNDANIQKLAWQLLGRWRDKATNLFTTPPVKEMERTKIIYKTLNRSKLNLINNRLGLLNSLQLFLK